MPGYEAELHYGLVAPAGTPRPIIDRLNAALRAALDDATLRERLAREGAVPLPSTPEEYAADIEAEEKQVGQDRARCRREGRVSLHHSFAPCM